MRFCITYVEPSTDSEKTPQHKRYYFSTETATGYDSLNVCFFHAAYKTVQKDRPRLRERDRTDLAWAMACQLIQQFDRETGLTETPERCSIMDAELKD